MSKELGKIGEVATCGISISADRTRVSIYLGGAELEPVLAGRVVKGVCRLTACARYSRPSGRVACLPSTRHRSRSFR